MEYTENRYHKPLMLKCCILYKYISPECGALDVFSYEVYIVLLFPQIL